MIRLKNVRFGDSGTPIQAITKGTIAINPASINATSRGAITWTLTGAAVGDVVITIPPAALHDDLVHEGSRVTGTNTVTTYLYNPTAGAIDDGSNTWDYLWIDLN